MWKGRKLYFELIQWNWVGDSVVFKWLKLFKEKKLVWERRRADILNTIYGTFNSFNTVIFKGSFVGQEPLCYWLLETNFLCMWILWQTSKTQQVKHYFCILSCFTSKCNLFLCIQNVCITLSFLKYQQKE